MRERPILFSAPMVRAILDGRKTQTRRVVKPVPDLVTNDGVPACFTARDAELGRLGEVIPSPYGQQGDRLWVRETWGYRGCRSSYPANTHDALVHYHADDSRREIPFATSDEMNQTMPRQAIKYPPGFDELDEDEQRWKEGELLSAWWERKKKIPSIHMPRWACRLVLEITGVRVERLHDIRLRDARAEGCQVREISLFGADEPQRDRIGRIHFQTLWESVNGAGAWHANPWVWVIDFKRVEVAHG